MQEKPTVNVMSVPPVGRGTRTPCHPGLAALRGRGTHPGALHGSAAPPLCLINSQLPAMQGSKHRVRLRSISWSGDRISDKAVTLHSLLSG